MTYQLPATPGFRAAATDSFFVLKDCRTLFQRRLADIARAAGISLPTVIEAFTGALGEGFDELAVAVRRAGFEQAAGLTASRITLMGDDDLELEIRIGEITKRLANIGGNALWKAHLRFVTLLRRPEMASADNPVGPQAIALGLWALCRESGGSLDGRLALLARLEEQCRIRLPAFYTELNDLLGTHGVEPAVLQPVVAGRSAGEFGAATDRAAANPLAALQTTLARQAGTPPAGDAGGVTLSAASLALLNQLLARLSNLDLATAAGVQADMSGQTLLRTLKAQELGMVPGGSEAVALETLAHIFDAIFRQPDLPDAVKTAIGRLQIPLLKAVLVDATFFTDAAHPARCLISAMGRAAVGLPHDAAGEHPICLGLTRIAQTVAEDAAGEPHRFVAALAAAQALVAERDAAAETASRTFLPLVMEQERRDRALAAACAWATTVRQRGVAPEIGAFIDRHWLAVMQADCLEGGEGGARWQADAATIDDLLWSCEPKSGFDDRRRLAGLVPSLLQRLNDGLDRLEVTAEQRASFLDACFSLQTAALKGGGSDGGCKPAAAPPMPVREASEPVLEEITLAGRTLFCLRQSGAVSLGWGSGAGPWGLGDWLRFHLPDGSERCGRLCWASPGNGMLLLANPDWPDAVAAMPAPLEAQLRNGRAAIVSATALFDVAADQALRQLTRGRS